MQVSGKQLSEIVGVSRARVSQLTKAGVLHQVVNRRYDLRASVRAVIRHIKEGQAGAKVAAARERYLDEQRRRLKLQNDQREGKLIALEEYKFSTQRAMSILVEHLNALPGRCAALEPEEDRRLELLGSLRAEVHRARQAMADALMSWAKSGCPR